MLGAVGMEDDDDDDDEFDAMKYIQWLHGLQSAQEFFLPWTDNSMLEHAEEFQYHSRRLCYAIHDDETDKVAVMDLEYGEKTILACDPGLRIEQLRLSSD